MGTREKEEYSTDDLRYFRWGPIDRGRPVDILVGELTRALPAGSILPQRWAYQNKAAFIKNYGSGTLWARTYNYLLLINKGEHVLRFWTTNKSTATVDVSDRLAELLETETVPESCTRKCRPLTHRVKVTTTDELQQLVDLIGDEYGVDLPRL